MLSPFRTTLLCTAALALLSACSTSRPVTLGMAQVAAAAAPAATVLQRDVTATDCPDPGDMYGDYNDAIAAALAQVAGANALINVRFAIKDTVGHYCMRVTGDAVRL